MFGFDEQEDSHSAYAEGMYSTDANVRVYKTLRETALTLLQARHTVIIDAAFLQAAERSKAMQMAQSCGFHAMIVQIRAPEAVMRKRIETRRKMSNDASESGIAVFERQMSKAQPLSDDERERSIVFENVDVADMVGLIEKVRQHSRQSETALLPGSLRHEAV